MLVDFEKKGKNLLSIEVLNYIYYYFDDKSNFFNWNTSFR